MEAIPLGELRAKGSPRSLFAIFRVILIPIHYSSRLIYSNPVELSTALLCPSIADHGFHEAVFGTFKRQHLLGSPLGPRESIIDRANLKC